MITLKNKKFAALLLLIALAVILAGLMLSLNTECSCAAVRKEAVKKAKAYKGAKNRLFIVKGAKYCFAKKKVKKGLQKVGKAYYFFNKSTGKMEKQKSIKIGKKYFFFAKNGKRYKYGFLKAGDAKANNAAGIVISGSKIKTTGKASEKEIRAAYRYIIKKVGYGPVLNPSLSSKAWIGKMALKAASENEAKCYGYAALTYSTFKALGGRPRLMTGTCNTAPSEKDGKGTEHAWVQMGAGEDELVYDSVYDATRGKDMSFFGKKISENEDGSFSIEGKDYLYYLGKVAA